MQAYTTFLLDLLGQFAGGRGDPHTELVRFGLGATLWAILLGVAWTKHRRDTAPREKLLLVAFGFGLARELFMLVVVSLRVLGAVPWESLHVYFPPLEHALLTACVVAVAAAYLRYLTPNPRVATRYLWVGLSGVVLTYVATFQGWAAFIQAHPAARFGQVWSDWVFHSLGCVLVGIAFYLLGSARGWVRNAVLVALAFFFADDALKLVDIALGEVYEPTLAPIRHSLHLWAIGIFGYVYFREQADERDRAQEDLRQSLLEVQKQADELRGSDDRYRQLFEHSNDAILVLTLQGRVSKCNSRACDLIGCNVRPLVGRPFAELILPAAEWKILGTLPPSPRGAYAGGVRFETIFQAETGIPIDVEVSSSFMESTEPMIVAVVRDITIEKERERERLRLEARLQRAHKVEALGTLAGGIAHDFNNILTPIIGYAQMAKRGVEEESPFANDLDEILQAASRAKDLVQQILTFSRQTEGNPQPLLIGTIVKEAVKLLQAALPPMIDITLDVPASDSAILADPTQIHQVVMNLCTNAGQAMSGGGTLMVALRVVELDEETCAAFGDVAPGPYVCLTVRDSGPGIPAGIQERIFDPYFTTKGPDEGTGLGLALVHGIVSGLGGGIRLTTAEGHGATFDVVFPAIQAFTAAAVTEETEAPRGSGAVLLVDDEAAVRRVLRLALERVGYDVTLYADGESALEGLSQQEDRFAVLVTDHFMPRMTGLDLAREVQRVRPHMPVVLCTGYAEPLSQTELTEAGIVDVLQKPVAPYDLARAVHRALMHGLPGGPDIGTWSI